MTVTVGCGPSDHRLTGDQWDQVVRMPAETTQAASELVQRDAESRKEWLSLHTDLQTERAEIGHQRDLLEDDRRNWSKRDRSDPIIAAAITAIGLLVACSLPLIVVAMLLWKRPSDGSSDVVCEILVEDLAAGARHLEDQREDSSEKHQRLE